MKKARSSPTIKSVEETLPRRKAELSRGQVASSELTREINRDVLLARIRSLQPISRVDLARSSGLQPSTVSSIIEQLLQEQWIREGAARKTARGRRPTRLSLNDEMVVLAADVRPSHTVAAVLDLNGRMLERQVVPLGVDPQRGLADVATVMLGFRQKHPECTFEGVGISLPGRVDLQTGRLLLATNLAWVDVDICAELESSLGMKVYLENAANASLLSELWFGRLRGVRNAVLLTISEGIGAAVLADERLIIGHRGMAGEFGHICLDPDGPVCGCGARGCWEVFASNRAALRYYEELAPVARRMTMVDLISLALDCDPAATKALERQASAIGRGMHLLNAVLSPDLILLAGDFTISAKSYLDIIKRECKAGLMAGDGPELILLGDGEVTRLRGAAAVALHRHPDYYRAARTH
jgi:predicted NBD/HSP70 family sugar kinase